MSFNPNEIVEKLKSCGVDVTPANLKSAELLLIQYECEPLPEMVVRVAVLRFQNQNWSDSQVVQTALTQQEKNKNQKGGGYGDELIQNSIESILQRLEDTGVINTIAEGVDAGVLDRVMKRVGGKFQYGRVDNRFSALGSTNERFQQRSLQADGEIIDASYTESIDDVINQYLPPSRSVDTPKLLSSVDDEIFSESKDTDNNQKKSLNGAKNGARN